ncbi:MAG: hypothetical protein AAFX90_20820 [Pseudomonadota bacterium]
MIITQGTFEGRGGHVLRGSFVIERRGAEYWLVTSDDFYFDGSPQPAFALSSSLTPTEAEAHTTRFLDLPGSGSLSGSQIEVAGRQEGLIAPGFDPSSTRAVFLWCFLTPFFLGIGPFDEKA